ncbi:MAG: hypothetical protein Q9181_006134 [Wetmoreana brouardii]
MTTVLPALCCKCSQARKLSKTHKALTRGTILTNKLADRPFRFNLTQASIYTPTHNGIHIRSFSFQHRPGHRALRDRIRYAHHHLFLTSGFLVG